MDTVEKKRIVAIRPKPGLRALFESVDGREEAKLRVLRTAKPDS